MKVVVDTNVFVGACLGVGAASEVIASCLRGQAVPLMGCALFAEYEDVLGRDELFASCRLDARERSDLLDIFLSSSVWTRIYYAWRPNLRDEGDNHLIELAIAGAVEFIVTRNLRDLAHSELRYAHLSILSPEQFLQEIRK